MLIVTWPSAEDDVVATNHLSVQGVEDRLVFEVAVVQDEVLDTLLVAQLVLLLQPRLQVVCELHRGLRVDVHRLVNNNNSGDNKYSVNNNDNTKNNNHSSNEPCRACGSHTCPQCRGCSSS